MFVPVFTKRFQKEIKLAQKRGKDIEKIKCVMSDLIQGKRLDVKYQDHELHGEYEDCRECHIQPDWLLIYRIAENELHFLRTGTHADLFE